jgi:hypothetical protein
MLMQGKKTHTAKNAAIAIRSQEGSCIVHRASPKLIAIDNMVNNRIEITSIATRTTFNTTAHSIVTLLHHRYKNLYPTHRLKSFV